MARVDAECSKLLPFIRRLSRIPTQVSARSDEVSGYSRAAGLSSTGSIIFGEAWIQKGPLAQVGSDQQFEDAAPGLSAGLLASQAFHCLEQLCRRTIFREPPTLGE